MGLENTDVESEGSREGGQIHCEVDTIGNTINHNKFVYTCTTIAARRLVSARRQNRYGPTNRPTNGRTHSLLESWLTKNLDKGVGDLVDVGSCFVDDEDSVVPQKRASQANQLTLPYRHIGTALGELMVQTARKSINRLKNL